MQAEKKEEKKKCFMQGLQLLLTLKVKTISESFWLWFLNVNRILISLQPSDCFHPGQGIEMGLIFKHTI